MGIREPRPSKKPDAPQWDGKLYQPVKFGDDPQKGTVEGEQNRRRELLTDREYRAQEKRLAERDALYREPNLTRAIGAAIMRLFRKL
jgi:hypothetical protein